jgi:hypothetical protein
MYLWYTHKAVDGSLRLAVPLVRKVFTASEESFRLPSGRAKRVVTGHGIDCERFAPGAAPRDIDVLSVGTHRAQQGPGGAAGRAGAPAGLPAHRDRRRHPARVGCGLPRRAARARGRHGRPRRAGRCRALAGGWPA